MIRIGHFIFISSLKLVLKEGGKLKLTNTQGHTVIIHLEPFKIEFLDKKGEPAVVINENSQMLMEPLMVRKEKREDEDGNSIDVIVSVCFCLLLLYSKYCQGIKFA